MPRKPSVHCRSYCALALSLTATVFRLQAVTAQKCHLTKELHLSGSSQKFGKPLIYLRLFLGSSAVWFSSIALAEQSVSFGTNASSGNFLGGHQTLNSNWGAQWTLSYDELGEHFGVGIHAGVVGVSDVIRLDGSYVELHTGDWTYGLGAVDRHWSPSRHSSMILSTNARPFLSAYLGKSDFSSFDTPLLAWIGPWKADLFLGQTEGDINPEHTKLFGARLQLQPLSGLEIELARTSQWGGEGRSESLRTLFAMLFGKANEGAAAEVNQLAGIGISYTLPQDLAPVRIYAQAIGEDEAGYLPSCFMYLGGVEGNVNVLGNPTIITLEGATTEIGETPGGYCGPGTAYNNSRYAGGYTNFGESMGLPIDSEGRLLQLIFETELPKFNLHWSLAYHEINTHNKSSHRLTSVEQDGLLARVGLTRKIENYSVTSEVWYQSYDLDTADVRRGPGVSFGVSVAF